MNLFYINSLHPKAMFRNLHAIEKIGIILGDFFRTRMVGDKTAHMSDSAIYDYIENKL